MLSDVRKIFDNYIQKKLGQKPEVVKFLLNHERKQTCLTNLCYEISVIEGRNLFFNAETYRRTIEDVAKMFASHALQELLDRNLSDAEKTRRQRQADSLKEAEAMMIDLEKETLRENQDEDWAKRRKAEQVQESLLLDASGAPLKRR